MSEQQTTGNVQFGPGQIPTTTDDLAGLVTEPRAINLTEQNWNDLVDRVKELEITVSLHKHYNSDQTSRIEALEKPKEMTQAETEQAMCLGRHEAQIAKLRASIEALEANPKEFDRLTAGQAQQVINDGVAKAIDELKAKVDDLHTTVELHKIANSSNLERIDELDKLAEFQGKCITKLEKRPVFPVYNLHGTGETDKETKPLRKRRFRQDDHKRCPLTGKKLTKKDYRGLYNAAREEAAQRCMDNYHLREQLDKLREENKKLKAAVGPVGDYKRIDGEWFRLVPVSNAEIAAAVCKEESE